MDAVDRWETVLIDVVAVAVHLDALLVMVVATLA